jgi:hypothetical protein
MHQECARAIKWFADASEVRKDSKDYTVNLELSWANFVHSAVRGILLLCRGAESKDNSSIGE